MGTTLFVPLCPARHIAIVIDAFGKGVEFKQRKDGQYDCTVRVPEFDMKLFAMQHAGFIRVTAPESLAGTVGTVLFVPFFRLLVRYAAFLPAPA